MFCSTSLHTSWVTTNIVGGLGNQLFLIANLIATAKRNNLQAFVTTFSQSSSCGPSRPTYWETLFTHIPQTFNVKLLSQNEANKLRNQCNVHLIAQPRPVVPIVLSNKLDASSTHLYTSKLYELIGFYQSDKFFSEYSTFVQHHIISQSTRSIARQMLIRNYCKVDGKQSANDVLCNSQLDAVHLVGMHVRRGDYLYMKDVFEELSLQQYYDTALRMLLGRQLCLVTSSSLHFKTPTDNMQINKIDNRKSDISDVNRTTSSEQYHSNDRSKCRIRVLIFCEDVHYGTMMANYFRCKYDGLQALYVHETNETQSAQANMSFLAQAAHGPFPREVVELVMLSMCHDIVMANSSFSWWASFLNNQSLRRVIAPSKWFVQHPYPQSNHIYCKD